jgi:hypothetical protein
MALRRRIAVHLVTAFLSVIGGFAATAVMADDSDAAPPDTIPVEGLVEH